MTDNTNQAVSEYEVADRTIQAAIDSRMPLEQAKGVLAERFVLSIDDAFKLLRYSARSSRSGLHELARAVVAQRGTPEAVLAGLARPDRWA